MTEEPERDLRARDGKVFQTLQGTLGIPLLKAYVEKEQSIVVGQNRAYDITPMIKRRLLL